MDQMQFQKVLDRLQQGLEPFAPPPPAATNFELPLNKQTQGNL